jgi:Antitoxin-like ribbon-helix-helix
MATRPSLGGLPRTAAKPLEAPAPEVRRTPPAVKPPSRTGKVQLSGYIDADAKVQLDIFAARERRTMQSIVEEMYDLFAHQHGLHRLMPSQSDRRGAEGGSG